MTTQSQFLQKYPLDFWVCAAILLSSIALFASSRGYPDKAVLFPSIMLVCMMGLSAYCMAMSLFKQRKALRAMSGEGQTRPKKPPIDLKAVCLFGFMAAAYAFCTPYLGFGLTSLLFIAAGTAFFGERDIRAIVGIPLATMLFIYAFFIYFLDVSIPFFPVL